GDPFAFISLLDETNLLSYIFPELAKNKHIDQPVRYHPFDNYVHTLLTLYELQKINTDYLARFAMLYHDVGKAEQYAAYEKGLDRDEIREILSGPLNHRNSGPELAKKDFSRLGFSKNEIKDISRYILKHHVPGEILDAKEENRSKKLRKLYSEAGFEKVNNLLDIAIADRLGQYNPMQNSSDITDVEDLRKILKNLKKQEGQFTSKDLKVDGKIIMEYFKISAGPKVGELLKQAMDWVMNDIKNRNNKKEILKYLKGYIKQ
ncbi:MAG TPA: HD domain-containing protein, partial [Candidatus Absconditabacterales bacterium]|nr:HD domain-containing protein [Candidatus Absconditabacterales bacterium]